MEIVTNPKAKNGTSLLEVGNQGERLEQVSAALVMPQLPAFCSGILKKDVVSRMVLKVRATNGSTRSGFANGNGGDLGNKICEMTLVARICSRIFLLHGG